MPMMKPQRGIKIIGFCSNDMRNEGGGADEGAEEASGDLEDSLELLDALERYSNEKTRANATVTNSTRLPYNLHKLVGCGASERLCSSNSGKGDLRSACLSTADTRDMRSL